VKNPAENMTWLVVEDDASFRDIVTTMCELWGVGTIVFSDGQQAANWLDGPAKEEKKLPNLALLDIRMPGLQGHEVAARIRRHPRLANMGIILMTAYELPGEEQERVMEELMKIGRGIIDKRQEGKETKEARGTEETKEPKEAGGTEETKEARGTKEAKEPKESKESKKPEEPKDPKPK
jgi:CheY-like chemotaxis protein